MHPPLIPLPPARPPVAPVAAPAPVVNADADVSSKAPQQLLSPSQLQLASPSRGPATAAPLCAGVLLELELSPTAANGATAAVDDAVGEKRGPREATAQLVPPAARMCTQLPLTRVDRL